MTDRATALRPLIQAAFDAGGLDAICELFATLAAAAAKLEARVAELEKRLNKNSSNSSKPPSSDGPKRKTKSLRPKNSGRKPGGQPGHLGQTLLQSENPDFSVPIPLDACPKCGGDLADQPVVAEEKRQVFDLPPIKIQVTEHRAPRKICRHCGSVVTAEFPSGAGAPAQYGPAMQALMSYLNVRQLIPCARTAEICQDILGHRPSAGSVVQAVVQCAARLTSAVDEIRDILIQSPVLHADETGVRCCGKTHWLHVVSTASHSLFTYSPKRGVEGFSVGQVLPHFSGTLVHDFWNPYDDWVFRGLEAHPEQVKPSGKRGRVKQSPETNLLRRLRDKREEVLRFSNDLQVPFDNN